jgi:xanthine dehydrogenase/oxidase
MGIGYYTSEEVLFAKTTGANLTHSTWKYKPPMSKDIPIDLRVELLHNAPNPTGILRSKREPFFQFFVGWAKEVL